MPLKIPLRPGVIASLQTYIQAAFAGLLDPTPSRRSAIGAKVKSEGSALHDWYVALKDYGDKQPFPQTATGDFLLKGWWRDITKTNPRPAASAYGYVMLTGTAGTDVPAGQQMAANGVTFTTSSAALVAAQSVRLTSIAYDSATGRCTATTASDHLMATGLSVTISGATPSAYNGTFSIVVTGDAEFTYTPATAPGSTPAGGTAYAVATYGTARVNAGSLGPAGNVSAGGSLSVASPPSGLTANAIATWGGIAGGTDKETPDEFRERILKVLGSDFGAFTGDEVEIVARSVPGVTRVFVKKATLFGLANGVNEGQIKVAFLRDHDPDPFPTAAQVAAVKNAIVANCMTANTAEEDVIVRSPAKRTIDVTASISPDTSAMRSAVTARLEQWFHENATYEGTVHVIDLRCALLGLVDPVTRATLASVSIVTPAADVALTDNQFPVLGVVTFA